MLRFALDFKVSTPVDRIRTSHVGSLPKPQWLAGANQLRSGWTQSGEALQEGQNDAVAIWLAEQARAGIDVVTDGEVRRRHYIWGFLDGLGTIDFEKQAMRPSRGQRYQSATAAPRVTSPLEWRTPVMLEALRFAKERTTLPVKVTLPGPMTVADSIVDEYGKLNDHDFAFMYAEILNREARALADAGADVIQIDEPCFNIYTDEVAQWGIAALERAFEGVKATRAVHICYGYGTEVVLKWKTQNTDWGHYWKTLPLLGKSSVDQISVECAASGVDPAVLEALRGKDVMVGIIDVGTEVIETPEVVATRMEKALQHVAPKHFIGCTDCGMVPRSRGAAFGKLQALAKGARLVEGR
jgi:5-methyltetrahydropteroyltriglutamate--homocysteine methyltransferase